MVDATTQAALEEPILHWRVLCYADFVGDVLRATTGIYNKTITGSGDSELDGTYEPLPDSLVNIGAVAHNESGSDTVTISLSGLVVNNNDFLNLVGDRANWQGRAARLWFYCVDEDENQVGSIIPYYTGYMNDFMIDGSPDLQTASITIENYLVTLSGARNKTYMMQERFDPGDLSAAATVAAANGVTSAVAGGGGGGNANGESGNRTTREFAR